MRRGLTPAARLYATDRLWIAAALLLLAGSSWRSVQNPDLFWHLSIGKRILADRAVPAADFLSFTRRGERYVDTEWLYEALCAAVAGRASLAWLIAVKAALLLGAALFADAALRRRGVGAAARGAALALLAAGLAPNNDVRPENFSLIFFAAELLILESPPAASAALEAAGYAAVFALWAALHGGFVLGLALQALYLAGAPFDRRAPRAAGMLAASAVGALIGPFGWDVYSVIFSHLHSAEFLSRNLLEWMWAAPSNPLNWPLYAGAALAAAAMVGPGRSRMSTAQRLALAAFAFGALRHRRLMPFFLFAAAVFVPPALEGAAGEDGPRVRRAAAGGFAVAALYLALVAPPSAASSMISSGFPARAANFLNREEGELGALRLYNPWGWGGYLGYRLFPSYPVYQYGSYLFYDQLADEAVATQRPEQWQDFLARHRLDLAVLRRRQSDLRVYRRLPGDKTELESRPYYVFFMPQDRWALVYWDDDALVFVRRGAAARRWLDSHEYRALHPGDATAIARALATGAAPEALVAAEACRHEIESGPDEETEELHALAAPGAGDCSSEAAR